MALELKRVACEVIDVPYLNRSEVVRLTGKVMIPVLVDGERVLTDSPKILEYLDEKYAPSLRAGPMGSVALIVEQWAESTLEDAAFRLACPGLEQRMGTSDPGREIEARAMFRLVKERRYGEGAIDAWQRDEARYTAQVQELLAPVALALASRPFILGDTPSVADVAVAGQLAMVEAGRPGWVAATVPALRPWFEGLLA